MKVPDLYVGKRLMVGEGKPEALGRGPLEARGSAYFEGPTITGTPTYPNVWATSMIGPNVNPESSKELDLLQDHPFPLYKPHNVGEYLCYHQCFRSHQLVDQCMSHPS